MRGVLAILVAAYMLVDGIFATEREAERLLLRELQHRMKNALATVQAPAAQTMQSSRSPETFIDAFSGRLAALAQVRC